MYRRVSLVPIVALSLTPAMALAQSYSAQTDTVSFVSIRGTGTQIIPSSADDGSVRVALPFALSFFGSSRTEAWVVTNGLLSFDGDTTAYDNRAIPDQLVPSGFVAPFWSDLEVPAGGGLYTKVDGVAGSQTLTIEWSGVQRYSQPSSQITMQVVLQEWTGEIHLVYGPSTGTLSDATIGIENERGNWGLAPLPCNANCGTTNVPNGTRIRFIPSTANPPIADLRILSSATIPAQLVELEQVRFDVEIVNEGAADSVAHTLVLWTQEVGQTQSNGTIEHRVAPLAAGQRRVETIDAPFDAWPGRYDLRLEIDGLGEVPESDESDNSWPLGQVTVVQAPAPDAGVLDSGNSQDAGTPIDSGTPGRDAEPPDAGWAPDASPRADASPPHDGGTVTPPDASTLHDGGTVAPPDATAPHDAGSNEGADGDGIDAGVLDSGVLADSGAASEGDGSTRPDTGRQTSRGGGGGSSSAQRSRSSGCVCVAGSSAAGTAPAHALLLIAFAWALQTRARRTRAPR